MPVKCEGKGRPGLTRCIHPNFAKYLRRRFILLIVSANTCTANKSERTDGDLIKLILD
jgi:hypothetical protein